ncbi:MAG: HEAT repeat domain-containing protein [Thermoplasmatota archaeon]
MSDGITPREFVDLAMKELLCSENKEVSTGGILHLCSLGKEASSIICSRLSQLNHLDDDNWYVVKNSVETLGLIRDPASSRTIVQLLRNEKTPRDLEMNDTIIRALIRISDPNGLKALIMATEGPLSRGALEGFEDRFVRIFEEVPSAETRRKVPSSLLGLLSKDHEKDLRIKILKLISVMHDPGSFDDLLDLLRDSEPVIRREVVRMIFQRRAGEYSVHLRKALKDRDEEVQALAMYGLLLSDRKIEMSDISDFVVRISSMDHRRPAVREAESLLASYIMRFSEEAEPVLREMIENNERGPRELAEKLLEKIGR